MTTYTDQYGTKGITELGVHSSPAGHYVGRWCIDGPYSRESEYYSSRESALNALYSWTFRRNADENDFILTEEPKPVKESLSEVLRNLKDTNSKTLSCEEEVDYRGCPAVGVGGYHSEGYSQPEGCAWCGESVSRED